MATYNLPRMPRRTQAAESCNGNEVGARLRELRRDAGLTQAEVATRLGTSQSAVARIESGRQRLSLAMLRRTAAALGRDVMVSFPARRAG